MNAPDGSGERPLNRLLKMAVLAGVVSAVRLHIGRGDDLDARDGDGLTPLMLAAAKNKASICALLLDSGANPLLTDRRGRNALEIAIEVGAAASAQVLSPQPKVVASPNAEEQPLAPFEHEQLPSDRVVYDVTPLVLNEPGKDAEEVAFLGMSGWESEHDDVPPDGDPRLSAAAEAAHEAMSTHVPTDVDEEWDDFKAFLPEHAMERLPRAVDDERRDQVRKLVKRALREGSVPDAEVEAICADAHGLRVPEAETLLRMVLGDLGAETDERIESTSLPSDLDDDTDFGEDAEVSEVLAFLDDLISGRNDPLKLYVKEMSRRKLLRADEERALAQKIEEERALALDALASWPEGVAAALAKADRVSVGETADEELSEAAALEPLALEDAAQPPVRKSLDVEESEEDDAASPPTSGTAEFLKRVAQVDRLKANAGAGGTGEKALREALASVNMSTHFLLGLTNGTASRSGPAQSFAAAMTREAVARERLTVCNLRLALSIAKRYQGLGLPIDDLVQEANIGLLKAVDRFDWRRGFRFSTYATWWIRQGVTRALADKGRTIRIPVHVNEFMSRVAREADWVEKTTGTRATAQTLAERLAVAPRKMASLLNRMEEPVSLHEPDVDGIALADGFADAAAADPADVAAMANLSNILRNMLSDLEPKTAQILAKRVGLDDDESCTLEKIGEIHGVTRERIRQLEAKGLRKLRHVSRSSVLQDFVDFSPTLISKGGGRSEYRERKVISASDENTDEL